MFFTENINLALGKLGLLSSTYHTSKFYNSLDGNRTPKICSRTKEEVGPWWQVDLESVYIIREVVIYNQRPCELDSFADLFELMPFSLSNINAK